MTVGRGQARAPDRRAETRRPTRSRSASGWPRRSPSPARAAAAGDRCRSSTAGGRLRRGRVRTPRRGSGDGAPAPWHRRGGRRRCRSRPPGTRPARSIHRGRTSGRPTLSMAEGTPRQTTACSNPASDEDLRHLGHVAEHVGQVADFHHPAEIPTASDAGLEIPDDGLAGHQELVHQDVPGTDGDASCRGQGPQPFLVLRPDLEVVVDDRQLPVEQEVGVGAVAASIWSSRPSMVATSLRRKTWNGSYHSRSQWVWGTTAMCRGLVMAAKHRCRLRARAPCRADSLESMRSTSIGMRATAGYSDQTRVIVEPDRGGNAAALA